MNLNIYKTIEYLNSVADTDYSPEFPPTIEVISALINVGYNFEDFKKVIDKKWVDWKGTKFEQYIRPSTLFGKNFENYLNEQPRNSKNNPFQKLSESVKSAKQANWRMDSK
jgi:uncharacterized phage protein (TIGR02220 family)